MESFSRQLNILYQIREKRLTSQPVCCHTHLLHFCFFILSPLDRLVRWPVLPWHFSLGALWRDHSDATGDPRDKTWIYWTNRMGKHIIAKCFKHLQKLGQKLRLFLFSTFLDCRIHHYPDWLQMLFFGFGLNEDSKNEDWNFQSGE